MIIMPIVKAVNWPPNEAKPEARSYREPDLWEKDVGLWDVRNVRTAALLAYAIIFITLAFIFASVAKAADDCDDLRKTERSLSSTRTDDMIAKYGIPQTEDDKLAAAQMRSDRAPMLGYVRERLKSCKEDTPGH